MTKKRLPAPAVCLAAFLTAACGQEGAGWFIDSAYSAHLLGSAQFYELRTEADSADTVDGVQIFRTSMDDAAMFDVREIRSQEWVYETSSKEWVGSFFTAARQEAGEQCVASQTPDVLHVLAFDRDLMRVGYFRYYSCPGNQLGALAPYGTSSLYFSRPLATMLEPLARNASNGAR